MTAATRVRLPLTVRRPGREDAQAAERVQAIKGRLDAATPGQWRGLDDGQVVSDAQRLPVALTLQPSRDFIASSPEDIAFLLARVDLLEGRCRDARADLELAATELTRLEDALQTSTAQQWGFGDENLTLKARVAVLAASWEDHSSASTVVRPTYDPRPLRPGPCGVRIDFNSIRSHTWSTKLSKTK